MYGNKGLPFIGMEWKQLLLLLLASVDVDHSKSCVSSIVGRSPVSCQVPWSLRYEYQRRFSTVRNNVPSYYSHAVTLSFPLGLSTHLMKAEGYKARSVFMRQCCVCCREFCSIRLECTSETTITKRHHYVKILFANLSLKLKPVFARFVIFIRMFRALIFLQDSGEQRCF